MINMNEELKEMLKILTDETRKTNKLLREIKTQLKGIKEEVSTGLDGLECLCDITAENGDFTEEILTRLAVRDFYDEYLDNCAECGKEPVSMSEYYSLIEAASKELKEDIEQLAGEAEDEEDDKPAKSSMVVITSGK
jgi:hypothetical protein